MWVLVGCTDGELRDRYASVVHDYQPKAGMSQEEPYFDPARALGPPDGKTVAIPVGASLTVRFRREIPDGPGTDLRVLEVGSDGAEATVSVSADGVDFFRYPLSAGSGGSSEFELADSGLSSVAYVRLDGMDDAGPDPGFDLDAIEALH